MTELKYKKEYAISLIKLFNYVTLLDSMLKIYMESSIRISYSKIAKLYTKINNLILHITKLKDLIIAKEILL